MLFSVFSYTHNKIPKRKTTERRRGLPGSLAPAAAIESKNFLIAHSDLPEKPLLIPKKASAAASGGERNVVRKKGSVTAEAAMAVPIFFLAGICMFYLIEMMAIQCAVRSGLQYAGKKACEAACTSTVLGTVTLQRDVVSAIGADRLERSIVEGGSSGIDTGKSFFSAAGIGTLSAKYRIRIPIPLFHIASIPCEETLRVKAWTGYQKTFLTKEDSYVYVTESGIVYHRNYHCSHLDLSIRMVNGGSVASLRNKDGSRYTACSCCKGGASGAVYITDYGVNYHTSLFCGGLKRTIYTVPLSEVAGKRPCADCGG